MGDVQIVTSKTVFDPRKIVANSNVVIDERGGISNLLKNLLPYILRRGEKFDPESRSYHRVLFATSRDIPKSVVSSEYGISAASIIPYDINLILKYANAHKMSVEKSHVDSSIGLYIIIDDFQGQDEDYAFLESLTDLNVYYIVMQQSWINNMDYYYDKLNRAGVDYLFLFANEFHVIQFTRKCSHATQNYLGCFSGFDMTGSQLKLNIPSAPTPHEEDVLETHKKFLSTVTSHD